MNPRRTLPRPSHPDRLGAGCLAPEPEKGAAHFAITGSQQDRAAARSTAPAQPNTSCPYDPLQLLYLP